MCCLLQTQVVHDELQEQYTAAQRKLEEVSGVCVVMVEIEVWDCRWRPTVRRLRRKWRN